MNKRETPAQWLPVLERHRIHSARDLAARLGVAVQTASRLLHGEQTSGRTIADAAALLGVTVEDIHELRGEARRRPFVIPDGADRLTPKQRAAVKAVILAMLENTDGTPTKALGPASADAEQQEDALPAPNDYALAARKGRPALDRDRMAQDEAAEESQDPDGQ